MKGFVEADRNAQVLFEVTMKEMVSENHIVHFIIEAVEQLENRVEYHVNERVCGSRRLNPSMMMERLIYSYAKKRFSGYEIEKAACTDIPTVYIAAMKHPDRNTINNFRETLI